MRITFFKTGKPKEFNYIPRYYNEQKEEFENRKKRIEAEMDSSQSDGYISRLRKGVMTERLLSKRKARSGSVLRLLIIIIVLTLITLYLLRDMESLNFLTK